MYTFFIFLHVLVSVLLIVVILMQSSKGGGLAGTFGGAASTAVFGGRGAGSFLSKVTVSLAIAFMALAIIIGLWGSPQKSGSVVQEKAQQGGQWTPVTETTGEELPIEESSGE